MLKLRPGLDLIAETGGKNSIIVTSMSVRDLAVKDLVLCFLTIGLIMQFPEMDEERT